MPSSRTGQTTTRRTRRAAVRVAASIPLAGTTVLAAACGAAGTGADSGSAAQTTSGPVTIYWSAWGGGERIDQYKGQAERFTRANPNIRVEFVAQSGTDYNAQITSMLASNTQLDVARLDGYFIAGYVANRSIRQLDELMKNDKTFKKSDYLDGAFLENHQVFDAKHYAMPSGDSPRVLWYNTAVWKSAGAPDPNELEAKGQWTWDAYLNAARQIAKGAGTDKVWATRAYVTADPEMWPWVHMSGGRVLSQDLKTVQIDQAAAVEALQWQVDLLQKHQVAAAPGQEPPGAFQNGKLGAFISGNWEAQGYKLQNFKDFGVAPLPRGPKGRFTTFKPNGLAMPATVKHQAQAWKLMRYLVDDLEKEYVDSGTFMAFRKDNVDYFLKNFPGSNAKWFVEPFNKKEVLALPITKHWADMRKIMNEELGAARDGKKSIREAVGEIKRLVDPLLKPS